jgi:GDP-L-fucose synthase
MIPAQKIYDLQGKKIWVAGHRGMVGSALVRTLQARGIEPLVAPRAELDLTRQLEVERWMERERPDAVIVAAAKVGGILANSTYQADFLFENLMIAANIIGAAARLEVGKLAFLGSTCIYPRMAPQPINEDALLTGPLEATNEGYAIAKIAGVKLTEMFHRQYGRDFISLMPTNLYGPGDNFDLASSHVLPALIRKIHEAKMSGAPSVSVWGSGTPRREFLHVDDLADATLHLMEIYSGGGLINAGTGVDITIREVAKLIAEIIGFSGTLDFDSSKPDGTPRKCTDTTRLKALGWTPRISLNDGIRSTYEWFLAQGGNVRGGAA